MSRDWIDEAEDSMITSFARGLRRDYAAIAAALRVGIVLVTPAMLRRLPAEGIADKELSALLRRERLVPVVHGTTYEQLEQVSLLLASRAGLSTAEESMAEVAAKIAELVAI
ncbi:con [Paracoccus sp. J39]|uniref:con n=1 Tax=Paracoccus sp. J39 TaxID=935848 RepID=UPI001E3CF5D1|nr:con [Paracoccus sp. J39]